MLTDPAETPTLNGTGGALRVNQTAQTQTPHHQPDVEIVNATLRGNRLKLALKRRKISQEEFSRLIGVSFRQTNRVILNQSVPQLVVAARMAKILGMTIEDLFVVTFQTRSRRPSNGQSTWSQRPAPKRRTRAQRPSA
jgi:transcriptional regulator with XRE-family HTH domain